MGYRMEGISMKSILFLLAVVMTASAADITIGSQGSQSSDPWCGS